MAGKILGKFKINDEVTRDYRNMVIAEVVFIFLFLNLEEILRITGVRYSEKFIMTIFLVFAGLYAFMLWNMVRNLTTNKWTIRGVLLGLLSLFIVGTLAENPFVKVFENPRPWYFVIHANLILIETFVIFLAIKDVFSRKTINDSHIWASACIYLTIGASFGSVYDLVNILEPGSFGKEIALGMPSYQEGIRFSLFTLGGLDTGFEKVSKLQSNLSLMESIWGNLYLVFLIGRIISLPVAEKSEERGSVE